MDLNALDADVFKSVFSRLYEAVFITDIDGVIVYANPAFSTMYGFDETEWKGKTPRILKSGLMKQENYEQFWQKLLSKETISGDLVNKKKNGDFITVSGSVGPIITSEGLVIGFVSIQQDVTQVRVNEKELRKFKMGIDKINDVVFMLNSQGEFEYVNPMFTNLYGYTLSELTNVTPRILKSGKQSNDFYVSFWQKLLAKESITADLINKTKHSNEVIVQASASAILDEAGEIVGFLAVQRDVTELRNTARKLEEKIQETDTMNRLMVSRELKMIELKEIIAGLSNDKE